MLKKLHELLIFPFKTTDSGEPPKSAHMRKDLSKLLPSTATLQFKELMDVYFDMTIEFPQLKAATAAQWALESAWGRSALSRNHNNYAGMKWRAGMEGRPVTYKDWNGDTDTYCHFPDERAFIKAAWERLDAVRAYKGWRNHVTNGEDFIRHIGPPWVGMSTSHQQEYVRNVIGIMNSRTKAIFE